jgi:alpha-L-arabinofuranosidase
MFNLLPVAKLAVNIAAGLGVSKVVGDVVKNSAVVVTRYDAFRVKAGILVISSIIAEQGTKQIDQSLDKFAAWYVKNRDEDAPDVIES